MDSDVRQFWYRNQKDITRALAINFDQRVPFGTTPTNFEAYMHKQCSQNDDFSPRYVLKLSFSTKEQQRTTINLEGQSYSEFNYNGVLASNKLDHAHLTQQFNQNVGSNY